MSKFLFSLPESHNTHNLNILLLKTIKKYPLWFYDDFTIETFYGAPFNCIWSSGRSLKNFPILNSHDFEKNVDIFLEYGIKSRLVLSNDLSPENISDKFTNQLLNKINSISGYVTLSSKYLYDYIENTYPNITICWSILTRTGSGEVQIENINKLSNNNLTVLPTYLNTKIDRFIYPNNIEVLLSHLLCIDYECPYAAEHVNSIHDAVNNHTELIFTKCRFAEYQELWKKDLNMSIFRDHHDHIITRSKMDMFADKGFYHFKLVDRLDNLLTLCNYIHYLIKPEYRDKFMNLYQYTYDIDLSLNLKNMNKIIEYHDQR